ncbi:MAG: sulfatase [Planctomycetaceae bacterium]|nr:sulfatase [Planctomycetaceae bacterium]
MRYLLPFLLVLLAAAMTSAAEKPNVLFIAVDDLNHWVGYTGRNPQTQTPNLDRLAGMGTAFTQAHCAVPACNPSRAALMSGMRASTTGCYFNQDFWTRFIPEGKTMAATFKQAGYSTWGMGKIFHSDSFYESEWDEYPPLPVPAHGKGVDKMEGFHEPLQHDLRDEDLADWHTVNFCIEKLSTEQEKPFFLACGLHKPHLPFAVPRKYYDQFPLAEIELPPYQEDDLNDVPVAGLKMARPEGDHRQFKENGRWKAAIQSYLATVAYTDMNIGRLLDAFKKSPHQENTIIVLWGDHGWHFGEKDHWRKFALWEEATRAPLIWVVPGVTKPGSQCEQVVDFMTIYPTLCDLAGISVPAHVEGTSLRMLLDDPSAEWETPALTTYGFRNHAIRTSRWRFIRYADGSEELYDHSHDPYEWTNLAKDPKTSAVRNELARWFPETDAEPPPKRKGE